MTVLLAGFYVLVPLFRESREDLEAELSPRVLQDAKILANELTLDDLLAAIVNNQ